MARNTSRTARWRDAAAKAEDALAALRTALEELEEVRSEYEEWRDNLPENLQGSALGDKLDVVADLDFEGGVSEVESVISEAAEADLPLGFGRD